MFFFFNPKYSDPGWYVEKRYYDPLKKRKEKEISEKIDEKLDEYEENLEEIAKIGKERAFNEALSARYKELQEKRQELAREVLRLEEEELAAILLLVD